MNEFRPGDTKLGSGASALDAFFYVETHSEKVLFYVEKYGVRVREPNAMLRAV